MRNEHLTAIIGREDTGYVSLCPELDIASQGDTVEEASANLKEAVELFFESASATEVQGRMRGDVFIWPLGRLRVLTGEEGSSRLQAEGFVQVRQRGSHVVMQKTHPGVYEHSIHQAMRRCASACLSPSSVKAACRDPFSRSTDTRR